jgi:acyl carrier protein
MEQSIRRFLGQNFMLGDEAAALPASGSLIEAGVIDSTGVLELVDYLEQTYAIRIADEELVPENLDSIANIVRYVHSKQQTAKSA